MRRIRGSFGDEKEGILQTSINVNVNHRAFLLPAAMALILSVDMGLTLC